jgi:hypothetical protein
MFVRRLRSAGLFVLLAMAAGGCATALEETFGPGRDGGGDTSRFDAAIDRDADGATSDTAPGDSAKGDAGTDAPSGDTRIDSAIGDTTTADTATADTAVADTAVPDTAVPDTSVADTTGGTTVVFPTSTSSTYSSFTGVVPLGSGGGSAFHYVTGDYVEQAYAVPAPVSALDLDITMHDATAGCAIGRTNSFAVKLNGTTVGSFNWVSTGGGSTKTVSQKYTFGAVALSAGKITIRIEATSTVCSGGSNWNWNPGGTATMR